MAHRKTEPNTRTLMLNFLVKVPPWKGTSETEITERLDIKRETVHNEIAKLKKSGLIEVRNRRIFFSENLTRYKDQVLLKEMFFKTLRTTNIKTEFLRNSGILFFQPKTGKTQLITVPLSKELAKVRNNIIDFASKIYEEGLTPENQKEARILKEKWQPTVPQFHYRKRRKKIFT
jgi:DNA-binding Lrp family transcriptional regulator